MMISNAFSYTFTIPGTYFVWGTARNKVGDKAAETLTITVYPNQYAVTYHANGGENAPEGQTKRYDEALTLTESIPTYMHHKFLGWAISADGEVAYLSGAEYKDNADITLYAVWAPVPYTTTTVTKYTGYALCHVSLGNMPQEKTLFVAGYLGDRAVFLEKRTTKNATEDFAVIGNVDMVRVFVWDSVQGLVPVTEVETCMVQ